MLHNLILSQQSPSIQSGVTFQWVDSQANNNDAATIQSITIGNAVYNTFIVPTRYEMTRLGPAGHAPNKISFNGNDLGINSSNATWATSAIAAFQDKNLNHYFNANPNGRDVCNNFAAALASDAQKQTLFYSPSIPSNEGGVIAVTERGANNCYYVEMWGIPLGGSLEQKLGQTFVRSSGDHYNCNFAPPQPGSDYWQSGRCNENGQTIGIGLFRLSDIAPVGSRITRIEFIGASRDHGDGKFFILQEFAVDKFESGCINTEFSGTLNLDNMTPEGATYSLISGPTPTGQAFELNTDGTYSYTPSDGFFGDVTFDYEVCLPAPNTAVCNTATATITYIDIPPNPVAVVNCTTENSDATITILSPLGTEFEYAINGGVFQASTDFTNLPNGNYAISVRNIFTGCENINSTIIDIDRPEVTATITDVLCKADPTGTIDITIAGGVAPFTYLWSNTATTQDVTNISAGTYSVAVTDATGCTVWGNFSVDEPLEALSSVITSTTDISCFGNNTGEIDLTIMGGSPPYTILWNTGSTNEDLVNLTANNYSVTITDANGCISTNQALISQPDIGLSASISNIVDVDCSQNSTGSFTVNPIGGIAPYQYSIDNGATNQTTGLFDNLTNGTYTVLITDANNCTHSITTSIALEDTENPEISVPESITLEGCAISDITTLNAVFSFNATGSSDVKSVFATNPAYNASDDHNIESITYIDSIISSNTCPLLISRLFTITDTCNNKSTTTQNISVQDTTAPSFNESLPNDITVECDAIPEANVLTANDNCSDTTVSFNDSITQGNCEGAYTIARTWTATDACGNTTTHTQNISVQDTTAPAFNESLPNDITVECDAIPEANVLTANDNCSDTTVSFNDSITQGNCEGTYTIARTWTATDACGNTTTHTQNISVQDTTAPAFNESLPNDITVECDAIPEANVLTANDNCSDTTVSFNDSITQGNCEGTYTIARTWTATDACGNTTTHTQNISVQDTTAPAFNESLPNDITVECDAIPEANVLTANDNCSDTTVSFNDSITQGNCEGTYTIARTWTATDACGNTTTHTQNISVQDTTAPAFNESLPNDITVECDAIPEANVLTANDNCSDTTVSFNDSITQGNCEGTYTIARTWTATDACGNTTTHTQNISVQDTTAPAFNESLPNDITVECDAIPEANVLTANDNCSDTTVSFNDSITQGNCEGTYTIARTWTATDACGNTTTHTQNISVQDTTAPAFNESLPNDITVECDAIPEANVLTANDNCSDTTVSFNDSITQGNCEGTYTIARTWTATDACGNTTTHTQNISVQDTTAPAFNESLPNDITVECDAIPEANVLTANDNCSDTTVSFNDSITQGNCEGTYTIARTWTATDACGNTTTHTQNISVQDTTAPAFNESLPNDITVECDAIPEANVLTANDNCSDTTVSFNDSITQGNCEGTYTIARTWTATDACGNTTTHTQNISVQDTTAPAFNESLPNDITVECDAIPEANVLTANDNCSDTTVSFEEVINDGACLGDSQITRTWTTTDDCGNTAIHTQIITVQDRNAPRLVTPFEETITVVCDSVPAIPNLIFEDECSNEITVDFDEEYRLENDSSDYQLIRTWTVTDHCGNVAAFTQIVFVEVDNVIDTFNANRCILDPAIDLFDLLDDDFERNGTWSVISGDTTIDQSIFDPATAAVGVYTFRYRIIEESCPVEAHVNVTIDEECLVLPCGTADITISKAVTANGDNKNDFFTVTGTEDCGFVIELQIFNRWGAEIYKTNNYQNDWNGDAHGSSVGASGKVPTGTYYYVINLKNSGLKPLAGPIYVATDK